MKIHSLLTGFLAIICLGIAAYAGWYMSNHRFWSHYPLFMLMGAWTGIILIVKSLRSPNVQSLKLLSLSIASGLLLAKGFTYTSPLLFIGFVPMLILQYQLQVQNANWKSQWGHAFNAFMFWNIGATYWVANAALIPAIVAFVFNSFFMTIPWMGMIWFCKSYPKLKYLGFIAFWLSFEWIHHAWEMSWPWLTLGNGLAFIPKFIQWYDITGAFGGSLWILLSNLLLAFIIIYKKYKPLPVCALLLLWIVPAILSYIRFNQIIPEGRPVEVAVVQPNYEPHYDKFVISQAVQMIRFEKLSKQICEPGLKYLIWPETSFEFIYTNEFNVDWRIDRMKLLTKEFPELCIVSGITSIKTFLPGEKLSNAARPARNKDYVEIQNSAIQICNGSDIIPLYVKSKLVPGVETFPYRKLLPFLKPIVDMLEGSIYGLGRQNTRTVFENNGNKIAPVICYESIYGNYIGDYIRNGAEAIFIMTNDGWWDDTPGHKQHLAYGALRAIEFRRPIARAANTGISCYINSKGEISQASKYNEETALKNEILFSSVQTIYLKWGDLISYIALCFSIIAILVSLIRSLKVRFSKNQ